ncbi:cell division cycle protein 20 homolog B-like [Oncorhynchus nerka]|uniref:cell division cycle protein 20 homolog B-like n=1 Tax=Oncorhynchus nerka TaxID=8023 RepID=UPI0031B8AF20
MDWKLNRYSRFKVKTEDTVLWENITRRLLVDFRTKRRHCSVPTSQKTGTEAPHLSSSYKRFKSRMVTRRLSAEQPLASSPMVARGRHSPCREIDTVCQRLSLDSPSGGAARTKLTQEQSTETSLQDTVTEAVVSDLSQHVVRPVTASTTYRRNVPKQDWVWSASGEQDRSSEKPFSVMYLAPSTPDQSKPQLTLALPSLQDDYYSHPLDWSNSGIVAMALGCDVFLCKADTLTLQGCIHPRAAPSLPLSLSHSVSSVSWSRDGCILGIGTKEGNVQLWDVEKRTRLRTITSHLSGVGALSWNQHVLSSGSVLGLIHHHDYRLDPPTVGVFQQQGAVCGLEWAPQGDWLASGSIDGLLNIWTNDLGSKTKTHPPARTMTQPSAVKAMAWCPWQKELIATGGGQSDGVLRIWNNQSGTCVDSAQTNSQVCSVVWSEERKALFTGHGLPHHHITCWSPSPSLEETYQLHGHMGRVLHLALSPNGTKLLSAGADCLGHVWNT